MAKKSAVVMGMGVDKAGGKARPGAVNLTICGGARTIGAHRRDAAAVERHIGRECRRAGAIEHADVANDEISHEGR